MKKIMALFHIKNFPRHATLATFKMKTYHVGHKWIRGSHPDCSVGHWVKWVNRCEPLSTLFYYISMKTDFK